MDKKFHRIIDANFNRAKEGLRVCEDIFRFLCDDKTLTRKYKRIRHRLTAVVSAWGLSRIILSRDPVGDVGKQSSAPELRRREMRDIFYANSQRSKESMRVLEEFAKLIDPRAAMALKRLRYQVYDLERAIVKRQSSLFR